MDKELTQFAFLYLMEKEFLPIVIVVLILWLIKKLLGDDIGEILHGLMREIRSVAKYKFSASSLNAVITVLLFVLVFVGTIKYGLPVIPKEIEDSRTFNAELYRSGVIFSYILLFVICSLLCIKLSKHEPD
jgi:hypothetical protein